MTNSWEVVGAAQLTGTVLTKENSASSTQCVRHLTTKSIVEEVESSDGLLKTRLAETSWVDLKLQEQPLIFRRCSSDSTECPQSPLPSPQSHHFGDACRQWQMPPEYYPLQEKYAILADSIGRPKELGRGAYGMVYQGFRKEDGLQIAIKVAKLGSKKVRSLLAREVQVLQRVADHPGVLKLLDAIESQSLTYLFIVTELCCGGDMWTYIAEHGTLNEDKARLFFAQLLDAVEYIHRNGCAHVDLKLENICIHDANVLKVIDFGLSDICSLRGCETVGTLQPVELDDGNGTLACSPPEVLQGKFRSQDVDMWGLGVVLYEMLTGRNPFHSSSNDIQRQLILQARYNKDSNAFQALSDEAQQLFANLFNIDPRQRPTIQQLRESAWMSADQREPHSEVGYSSDWDTMPQRFDVVDCQCTMCKLFHFARSSNTWTDNFVTFLEAQSPMASRSQ